MALNVRRVYDYINEKYEGNMTAYARAVGLSASTITRLVNGENVAGAKVINKIIEYCKKNGLDYMEFITI